MKVPFPETIDSVEASCFARNDSHLYIPISHFNVNLTRVIGIALEGFWSSEPTYFYVLEVVTDVPFAGSVPPKLLTGTMHARCTADNMVAFGIDDGVPSLAQRTLEILYDEGVPATFFVQGRALMDRDDNFTNAYLEAHNRGHRIALHSFSHPRMESLESERKLNGRFSRTLMHCRVNYISNHSTSDHRMAPLRQGLGRPWARSSKALKSSCGQLM